MKNILGTKFGRWTAIDIAEKRSNRDGGTRIFWRCECECGNIRNIDAASLKSGHSKSCGCLRKDRPKILPYGIPERNLLFRTYKKNAQLRNLEFYISIDQFTELIHQNCFYCGIEPTNQVIGKGFDGKYSYNGIDRIDNSKGYYIENCVSCCETCNKAKRTMSQDEFYSWVDRIYKHRRRD